MEKEEWNLWKLSKVTIALSVLFGIGIAVGIIGTVLVWGMDQPMVVRETEYVVLTTTTTTIPPMTPFVVDPSVYEIETTTTTVSTVPTTLTQLPPSTLPPSSSTSTTATTMVTETTVPINPPEPPIPPG